VGTSFTQDGLERYAPVPSLTDNSIAARDSLTGVLETNPLVGNQGDKLLWSGISDAKVEQATGGIVFIDSSVQDYQSLIAGIKPGTEVAVLDPVRNEVEQIGQYLAGRRGISSLHIVSHGDSGSLQLGETKLGLDTLNNYGSELQQWGKALKSGADILLYGCNVAEGEQGAAFVKQFSQLTGADIAASTDLTGNAALGGDWNLEVNTGEISTPLALVNTGEISTSLVMPTATQAYNSVLDDVGYAWAKKLGGSSYDTATGITVDSGGNVYTTGNFYDTADFDPGDGISNLASAGSNDIFISKLSPLSPLPTISLTATDTSAAELLPNSGAYQITRNSSTGALTVKLNLDAISTAAADDYALSVNAGRIDIDANTSTATVVIPDGVASVILTLTANDDIQAEAAETLKLNLATDSAYAIDSANNTGTVTIDANDTVVINTNDLTVNTEDGIFNLVQLSQFFNTTDLNASSLFDESFYLAQNPDIAEAVASGAFGSGFEHFQLFGQAEDRDPSLLFNNKLYLAQNPDVEQAVAAGAFQSGFEHFLLFGQHERRDLRSLIFDEAFYLEHNPDVAQAVASRALQSGFDHSTRFGQAEGRNPSVLFDEDFYLANNPDVAQAVSAAGFRSGFDHFIRLGIFEGRNPSRLFDNSLYLAENPDVAQSIATGVFRSGFDHFIRFGQFEDRQPHLQLFDEDFYLDNNPDVAQAVAAAGFRSGFDHFIRFGQAEGRNPSNLFDEDFYLDNNPDVAQAVAAGGFRSGFDHFIRFGRAEGRSGVG